MRVRTQNATTSVRGEYWDCAIAKAQAGAYRAMITKTIKRRKCNIARHAFVCALDGGRSQGMGVTQGFVVEGGAWTETCGRTKGTSRDVWDQLELSSVEKTIQRTSNRLSFPHNPTQIAQGVA